MRRHSYYMAKNMRKILFVLLFAACFVHSQEQNDSIMQENNTLELGAFSVSLAVKDIHKSKAFYEKLGFTYKGGNIDQNWIVLKNGSTVIGLFQEMFEGNILTFNPGWDQNAQNLEEFTDVRDIQKHMKENGIQLEKEVDESTQGPEHIILKDPDGNVIMFDQHR